MQENVTEDEVQWIVWNYLGERGFKGTKALLGRYSHGIVFIIVTNNFIYRTRIENVFGYEVYAQGIEERRI